MKAINGILKWLALLTLCLAAGLGAIIYLSTKPELDMFWMRIILLLAVAFIGSLVCRLFFHRLPGLILLLVALFTELLALLVIDYFYAGLYRFAFLTNSFVFVMPSPSDGAQLALMLLVMLPTLFFLRRRKKSTKAQTQSAPLPAAVPARPAKAQVSLSERVGPVLSSVNPANWQVTHDLSKQVKKISKSVRKTTAAKPVRVSAARSTSKAAQTSAVIKTAAKKSAAAKPAAARKARNTQTNDVKLMGEEEHVCPYCLEKVNKNDRKVICPECGTWHHQDCWDLTGACGVAHRNEL